MVNSARLKRASGVSVRFLLVGALSTVIELAVFNLLFLVFKWDPVSSKIVSSLVALVNAYFGNREWAFRHRGSRGRGSEIVLFLVVNGLCTALGAAIVAVGTWMLPHHGVLLVNAVNLVSIVLVVLVRFVLYHFVVFPGKRMPPPASIG